MLPRLAELNTYVPVHDLGGKEGDDITIDLIQGFHVSNCYHSRPLFLTLFRSSSSAVYHIRSSWRSTSGRTRMASISFQQKPGVFLGEFTHSCSDHTG
jgi:hypothetical protein